MARGLLPVLALCIFWPGYDDALQLTALSVGQGESLLLSLPQGGYYLVDGGGLRSDTFDVGERLLLPALAWMDVPELEAVILTHAHPDHYAGLCAVLANFPVRSFKTALDRDKLPPELRDALNKGGVSLEVLPEGWSTVFGGSETHFDVFVPPQIGDANNRSVVGLCRFGADSLLLTGDLEKDGVRRLLDNLPIDSVGLLKLPHHGSRNSGPEVLLDRLQPRLAFASSGKGNSYGFPHVSVVGNVKERGISFYRTDWNGSLQFISRGEGWHAHKWSYGLFR